MTKIKYIAPGWVPKTQPAGEKLESFFIGRAPYEEDTTDVAVPFQDNKKQSSLYGPLTIDTKWKKLIRD